MARSARPAAALGALLVSLLALAIMLAPPVRAAAPTFTYNRPALATQATLTPTTAVAAAGSTITIFNNSPQTVTISGQLVASPPKGEQTAIAPNATGAFVVPAAAATTTTVSFTADEPPIIPGGTKVIGSLTVTPTSAEPGGAGAGGAGGPAAGRSGSGRGSAGAPFVGPGLPGGVLDPLAPGATAYPNGPAPLVAPFATATSVPPLSSGTGRASPAPLAAASAPGGRSGDRDLGLPAAVAAVALVGVGAALIRVLLAHPAGRAVTHRH